jgi:periplasmic protein TonB
MRRFAFLSLGLHLAVLAGLFAWSQYARPTGEAPDVQGAVELVLLEQQGTRATAPPPPPAPAPEIVTPALSEAQAQPLPPPPPVPQKEQPAPAKQHASASPVQRAVEAPEINLNGNNSETNALVSGDHVVPAGVDARFHNKEPVYPLEAVRRAQQGMVTLLIHVSPEGLAAGVDVVQGSGYVLLDRAARDAVVAWRFLPAVKDGQPIPFDMKLRVVFHLD